MSSPIIYDVAIIGGGAAGMMAAGTVAESGANIVLIEKNDRLGKKLLITGKGRCNVTNNDQDVKSFCDKFGSSGKFLYSSLYQFGVNDVINFFSKYGVKCKIERGNRVFPESDKAQDILNALIVFLRETSVNILLKSAVKSIKLEKNSIFKLLIEDGREIVSRRIIICTGGKSYPTTGSNGDGYKWIQDFGHSLVPLKPVLVSVKTKEKFVKDLQGLSLKNVKISIIQNDRKIDDRFGELLFTSQGLSGPIVLDLSKRISELLISGPVKIVLDFKPALDNKSLDLRILRDFKEQANKEYKNSLSMLLPKKLIPVIIDKSGINPVKPVNSITKDERKKLLHLLKEFSLTIDEVDGFSKAIITSGGINLKEITPTSMESKIVKNLFFAGEIIDLDGPTGGYNLQLAWSTARLAANNCLKGTINEKGKD
ncbi:MAG: hypothetical protein A2Y40_10920 [Candidatus Margulisbacteria bacterium GWF2_35_9]|nr:MAG: hypothetical protein A2Y40_10920 [Candidatus Margulisbacteria bacterium GWF2_35_9]